MNHSGKIIELQAFPISCPIPPEMQVTLGIGRQVKRDAVIVKVTTDQGLVGYGESHHGRAPSAVAQLVNTTLKLLVTGMQADDVVGVWNKIYLKQLASHGMGAGCALAMSGIDQALWDIRGKACGWPLYRLLGGARKPIPAYAGGVALGYQAPAALVEEVRANVEAGYKAVKLRVGDTPARDIARVAAVRKAFDDLVILTDGNTGCSLEDVRRLMPAFQDLRVGWLEEPFPCGDYASYKVAATYGTVPLAAGENHYTRFEFNRLIEDGAIRIFQPDVSKTGGITEGMRIAALASAWKIPINPHTSMTGLNMAASIHFLAAIDNGGYFEADVAKKNVYRDGLTTVPYQVDKDGNVLPLDKPGIGVDVDEAFIQHYPVIEGPAFV